MSSNNSIALYSGGIAVLFVGIIVAIFVINSPSNEQPADNAANDVVESQQQFNGQESVDNSTSTNESANRGNSETTDSSENQSSQYTDGVYTATGTYASPASSNETISVTLTIDNDLVTAVETSGDPQSPTSENYQTLFKEGISGEVVGKNLGEISPDRVNGSSLTPAGFNQAIQIIKNEAQIN